MTSEFCLTALTQAVSRTAAYSCFSDLFYCLVAKEASSVTSEVKGINATSWFPLKEDISAKHWMWQSSSDSRKSKRCWLCLPQPCGVWKEAARK